MTQIPGNLVRSARIALNSGVIIEFPAPQDQIATIHNTWIKYNEKRFPGKTGDQTITIHSLDGGIHGFKLADISAVLNSAIPVPNDDSSVSEE